MTDNFNFDPKANPLTGVSLADLVAARQAPITTALQQAGPMLQALQQRQQLMALANGLSQPGISSGQSSLTPEQIMYGLNNKLLDAKQAELYGQGGQEQRSLDSQYRKAQIDFLNRRQSGSATNLSDTQKHALQYGIEAGYLDQGDISSRGPRAEILANGIMNRPDFQEWHKSYLSNNNNSATGQNFDPVANKTQIKGKMTAAATDEGMQMRSRVAAVDSALPQLKRLDILSQQVPRSEIQKINEIGVRGAAKLGNRYAQRLITQANQLALNMQRVYPTGSDKKLDLDMKNLSEAQTVEQMSDSIKLVFADLVDSRNALTRKPYGYMSDKERALGLYPSSSEEGGIGTPEKKGIGGPVGDVKIRVRLKSNGQTGTVPMSEYNPSLYEKL